MKFWKLACLALLATGCSHSGAKNDKKEADPAPAAKSASAPKAAAKSAEPVATDRIVCTKGSDERLVDIVAKGNGCAVEYTKQQQKKEIASAEYEPEHCKQVLQKVRGKLEAAGYTCH